MWRGCEILQEGRGCENTKAHGHQSPTLSLPQLQDLMPSVREPACDFRMTARGEGREVTDRAGDITAQSKNENVGPVSKKFT